MLKWRIKRKSGIKTGNRINFLTRRKSAYHIWEVYHQISKEIRSKLLKSEDFKKSGKSGKNRKPDKFPEYEIII